MLKDFFIKGKYGLIVAAVILLAISYQLALKKTIAAWQLNSRLRQQVSQAGDLSFQPGYLDRKNKNLEQLVKSYTIDSANFRSGIINNVALVAETEKVKVTAIPVRDISLQSERLMMQQLELAGTYPALMKACQKLYSLPGIGLVRSVTLKKPAQTQSKNTDEVLMDVYITAIR
ncbi:hypothetical protein A0256_20865 [Mucilaginibacter sp. PAMC 26640]|nr:hypothetical protein A0256_20865 [Mucilaginibacter sp. PAMC 26640]